MSDHLSPRKLPSSHSTMSNHLGLPFYLPFQTYQVLLENLLILSICFSPQLTIGILVRFWWWAVSASLVCPYYTRVPKLVKWFFELSWRFFIFLRSVTLFCFVSLVVGTRSLYTSSAFPSSIFWTFLNISSRWIQDYLTINKQGQKLFFLPLLVWKWSLRCMYNYVKGKQ